MNIKFINATILTLNEKNDIIFNGEVYVCNNLIEYVGKNRSNVIADRVIDLNGKIIMPGFINTHCHNAMSLFRGVGGDLPFESWWVDAIRPYEDKINGDDIYYGTMLSAMELLKSGVTTTVDLYLLPEIVAKALNKIKIRAFVGVGTTLNNEIYNESFFENQAKSISKLNSSIIKPIGFVHAIYSSDEQKYADAINFVKKNNLVFTTHISETLTEAGECDNKYGMSPIQLLESYGVLDTKCILAHAVYCDKDDVEILKNYDVSISTNPSSNLYLGSGIAPIYSYKKNNINVTIGTDGVASNNSLNFFKEMFLVKNLQSGVLNQPNAITNIDVLKMATINGAKALNEKTLGMIKKGFLADIIVIDSNKLNMQPLNNIECNLVNSCGVENVVLTMVNGEILYENNKFNLEISEDEIIKKVNQSINRIKNIRENN